MSGKYLKGLVGTTLLVSLISPSISAEPQVFFTEEELATEALQDHHDHEGEHHHAHTLTPEEEKRFYEEAFQKDQLDILNFRFPQTSWRECTDVVTGNYSGYNCANRRQVSVILKDFMDQYMPECVQEALDKVGDGELDQLHIIHDGVLGDRRHSPRSLHAENRAIDIRSFRVRFYDGREKTYVFKGTTNREFYRAFRQCWGQKVSENNGCPYYGGSVERTGSIGWEDRNHQNHMHTSVPYCVGGSYGSYYFRR